jgi:hypothetical protein
MKTSGNADVRMLEFYSVRSTDFRSAMAPFSAARAREHARGASLLLACAAAQILTLAGCATAPVGTATQPATPAAPPAPAVSAPAQPSAPPLPRNVEPPAPKMNLSGFPLPYRQGYADGCASATGAERKDATRFSSDMNYRTGWTDGRGLCKPK